MKRLAIDIALHVVAPAALGVGLGAWMAWRVARSTLRELRA